VVLVNGSEPVLGADVRAVADVLAALFDCDRELVAVMNAAQRRLLGANDDMRGLSARAAGPLCRDLSNAIRAAFNEYQQAAEHRRRLGADVGEAAARLDDALRPLGYSEAQARNADVWALRDGVYRPAGRAER
jgi:Holliday junction resolvasome RuvABC DNA-binding subunit